MDLWNEVPETTLFAKSITQNLDKYKLFPTEDFDDLRFATLATSAVDLQREAFTPNSLKAFVKQIEKRTLWVGALHDPLIQPYGRIVAAKRFYSPKSQLYFVAGVIGLYDPKTLRTFKDVGVELVQVFDDVVDTLAIKQKKVQLAFSPHEVDTEVIRELMNEAPELVDKNPLRSLRKSAEPITIVSILASIWLLSNNPFSKKFLERYGEKAADGSLAFFSWLSNKVFKKLDELKGKRVLFEFVTEYKGCRVQFVVPSKDTSLLCEAANSVYIAGQSAQALIDQLEHLKVDRLIYEFDLNTRKWLPLHATSTLAGVISDRPYLIALDQMKGFSVGGVTSQNSIVKSDG